MDKKLSKNQLAELNALANAAGLTHAELGRLLDADARTVTRWLSGERPPRHFAMLKKAMQLVVLEQSGVITARLLEVTEIISKTSL